MGRGPRPAVAALLGRGVGGAGIRGIPQFAGALPPLWP